jgi:ankyrin repeat protein
MNTALGFRVRWWHLAVLAAGVLGVCPAAQAQINSNSLNRPAVMPEEKQVAKPPPPAAVPGARSDADEAAPAQRPPTDMEPTEALFDAINRGDIATVKDAIGRGADLDGRNILGLTPLELSVDVGRNDISFLLLSLRGARPATAPVPAVAAGTKLPGVGKSPVRQAKAGAPGPVTASALRLGATSRGNATAVMAVAQQKPRLFAGDGGTPVPSAGFLGFSFIR